MDNLILNYIQNCIICNFHRLQIQQQEYYILKYFKNKQTLMTLVSSQQSLQQLDQQLFSLVRRSINSLKEKDQSIRKNSIGQLIKIVKQKNLSHAIFQQIMHMGLKDIIKCYYDHLQVIRENAIKLTIQLLSRCDNIKSFLPYIFQALKDRTNCVDIEGIDKLPEKMRPQPGQKPKMMLKLIQSCQEIRMLYCQLVKRIVVLLQQDKHEMSRHLDDMVNILRALIMDPAPDVQKQACEVLIVFCNDYKDILLHFTETMGRAVLLPLISKKSKIRIAGLNALTAIFWCGLWKYNAFVFENLIGFRDPNSVPIKDFYQPSNNINYLATFIIDPNVKVRQQFMKHLKIWICDLNDKYDHHGKLVPYLLSGLSDPDEQVQKTAVEAIKDIGKQIQEQKQKQFRENKQFAIDAAWTWDGKLNNLPIEPPLLQRPSLGSRYFVRGHVRKFWAALYKQIRDLNQQNRIRSANLALFGVLYTENYLAQFLDNFIPQMLPSILPISNDSRVAQKICKIFYYIGRYCQQSAYIHLMKSALQGKLIQNEQFVKCAMKGLAMLIKGNLQAIPKGQNLCHKKENIIQLLTVLQECEVAGDVYNFNCVQAKQIALQILRGIVQVASEKQRQYILSTHFLTLVKLIAVSYFEQLYSNGFSLKNTNQVEVVQNKIFSEFVTQIDKLHSLYPNGFQQIQQFLSNVFCNPPSLMDSDWKLLTIFYRYFCIKGATNQQQQKLFLLVQDTISECLSQNRSIQMITFSVKYIYNLVSTLPKQYQKTCLPKSDKFVKSCITNLEHFKPVKKVPIYDQPEPKPGEDPNQLKTSEQNYSNVFLYCSKCLSGYYLNRIPFQNNQLAELLQEYIKCFKKIIKIKESLEQAIKTIWAIFQKIQINDQFGQSFKFQVTKDNFKYMLPEVIDFCVARLQENLDSRLNNFVFRILENITRAWPKLFKITDKLQSIYPDFPQLLQKLFKYCLNEKDIETKQKYKQFLQKVARKMPDWFKYQANLAQQQKRYEKARAIQQIVQGANI